ncbi:HD domain-containing protein [bacterium]|nr:HD domain-containing protein [bacterium]
MPEKTLHLPLLTSQLDSLGLWELLVALQQEYPSEIICVGGCIRDTYYGRHYTPFDMDLIALHPALVWPVSEWMGNRLHCTPFWLDAERKIARVQTEGLHLDINAIRADTLAEDALYRDFTLNSLMIPLEELIKNHSSLDEPYCILDFVQGVSDLFDRILRTPRTTTFLEDPLRILRLIRFKGIFSLEVDPDTLILAQAALPKLPQVAGERIREEWNRLLELPDLASLLFWCDREHLFGSWFPFLSKLAELDKNFTNPISVREHTLYTLSYLEQIFRRIFQGDFPHAEELTLYLQESWVENRDRAKLLKMSALLHDIGKADTATREESRLRFFGHEDSGVAQAEPFLSHQGWSKREIEYILVLIRTHMRPHGLSSAEYVTPNAQFRFFRQLGEAAIGSLLLALADAYATRMLPMGSLTEYEQFIARWLDFAYSPQKNIRKPLLNGDIIMEILQIPPSPLIRLIMEDLMEQESEGNLHTSEEASQYILRKKEEYLHPKSALKDEKKSIE